MRERQGNSKRKPWGAQRLRFLRGLRVFGLGCMSEDLGPRVEGLGLRVAH